MILFLIVRKKFRHILLIIYKEEVLQLARHRPQLFMVKCSGWPDMQHQAFDTMASLMLWRKFSEFFPSDKLFPCLSNKTQLSRRLGDVVVGEVVGEV